MSKEKQIEEMIEAIKPFVSGFACGEESGSCELTDCRTCKARNLANGIYNAGYRKQIGWISVDDRLPTEDEYLTHHNDGLDTLKRLLIAYQTDTIEYQIGCYDGWKWMNQLGNRVVKGVVAWKPFEAYELPKMKGGAE